MIQGSGNTGSNYLGITVAILLVLIVIIICNSSIKIKFKLEYPKPKEYFDNPMAQFTKDNIFQTHYVPSDGVNTNILSYKTPYKIISITNRNTNKTISYNDNELYYRVKVPSNIQKDLIMNRDNDFTKYLKKSFIFNKEYTMLFFPVNKGASILKIRMTEYDPTYNINNRVENKISKKLNSRIINKDLFKQNIARHLIIMDMINKSKNDLDDKLIRKILSDPHIDIDMTVLSQKVIPELS